MYSGDDAIIQYLIQSGASMIDTIACLSVTNALPTLQRRPANSRIQATTAATAITGSRSDEDELADTSLSPAHESKRYHR